MNASSFDLSGHRVDRVGFGAMQLPGPGVMGPPRDHRVALTVLRHAVEHGVQHIDTAEFYGPEVANQLIREALHPYPDDLVLVTKVGAMRDAEGAWLAAQQPDALRAQVLANLQTLATDRLGAVNLRLMNEAPARDQAPLADQLDVLVSLRDEGRIEGIGLSTATLDQVQTAHESVGLVCVQNAYNFLDRSDDPVLDYCTQHQIAYVPYFPLGSAFPTMPKVTDDPQIQIAARELGATPAQVGLAWLLRRADNVLLIPGTSSVAHLTENLAVRDLTLEPGQLG